jgi:hypothetical protein
MITLMTIQLPPAGQDNPGAYSGSFATEFRHAQDDFSATCWGARCVQDEASSRFSFLLSMNFSGKSVLPSGRGPMGVIFRTTP